VTWTAPGPATSAGRAVPEGVAAAIEKAAVVAGDKTVALVGPAPVLLDDPQVTEGTRVTDLQFRVRHR